MKRALLLPLLLAAAVALSVNVATAKADDPLLAPASVCGDPSASAPLTAHVHGGLPGPKRTPRWFAAWRSWRLSGQGNRPAGVPRRIPSWATARLKAYEAKHPKVPNTQLGSMRCYHNWARVHDGLKPLAYSAALAAFSAQKSAKIVQCGVFTHTPCGQDAFQGFPSGFSSEGENLVMMGPVGTVRQMFALWLASPGHRANILGSSYRKFGLHLYVGPGFGSSSVMMWCADFGG